VGVEWQVSLGSEGVGTVGPHWSALGWGCAGRAEVVRVRRDVRSRDVVVCMLTALER